MKMYKYCLNLEMNYFPIIYIMLNRIFQTLTSLYNFTNAVIFVELID